MNDNQFIENIRTIIDRNLGNSQFGVTELAEAVSMSRSNLLRRVKKETGLSVSAFIRQSRLESAKALLEEGGVTVSEVAYEVGFSSPSYFIKCFHEEYGYSPGEVGKQGPGTGDSGGETRDSGRREFKIWGLWGLIVVVIVVIIGIILVVVGPSYWWPSPQAPIEKSIAVLPFRNNSADSSNIYLINGVMGSVLNNLQKIEDLRVISRTSVEHYRNAPMIIPEMAKELDVNYFIEGNGQKVDDQIRLQVRLIEAKSDRQVWAYEYNRELVDIFSLQNDIAIDIVREIKAIITPEEIQELEKVPTDNPEAYDNFLKGYDLMFQGQEHLLTALIYYHRAVELDPGFARALAGIAITYFFLEAPKTERIFLDSINYYADQALLADPKLPQGLLAKALYFLNSNEYKKAEPFLEKAYEYHPNSPLVISTLSDFYTTYLPNTEKYLEYALKGLRLDKPKEDSVMVSFLYLHVANALIQAGFIDESAAYIDLSLQYDTNNLYTESLAAYHQFAIDQDLDLTHQKLLATFNKDTTRLDLLVELGKINFYRRDFEEAYRWFSILLMVREQLGLSAYTGEDAKIAETLQRIGMHKEAAQLFENYRRWAEENESIYKDLSLSVYYSATNDKQQALAHLKRFSELDHYHYWILLFLKIDPLYDNLQDEAEFHRMLQVIEDRFLKTQASFKKRLTEQGLL